MQPAGSTQRVATVHRMPEARPGRRLRAGARAGRIAWCMAALLAVPVLAGCQGMYEGSAQRTVGETIDDGYISTTINRALLSDPELSFLEIDVDVRLGVVVLNGAVPSRAAESKLVGLAKGVRGVKEVQSRLVIVPGTPDP